MSHYHLITGEAEFTLLQMNFIQVSNLPFLILPPILMCLFRDYGRQVGFGVHLVWILFIIIGVGSAYFHATLSLFGQLWDELGILWALAGAWALWVPKRDMPAFCKHNRYVTYFRVP